MDAFRSRGDDAEVVTGEQAEAGAEECECLLQLLIV
jgi:hypothetical protein